MLARLLSLCLLLLLPAAARAHDGPPFPLLLDEKAGPYKVSVWADPDVGTGTFFVYVEAPGGSSPDEVTVTVSVRPKSGRLPETSYTAERRKESRRIQHYVEVAFDAQEYWDVRFDVKGPAGQGELSAEVEATPPGLGSWDFALYLFPFVLMAALWAYGVIRYRNRRSATGAAKASSESCQNAR
jgi:hypothetical protein